MWLIKENVNDVPCPCIVTFIVYRIDVEKEGQGPYKFWYFFYHLTKNFKGNWKQICNVIIGKQKE